MAVFVIFFGRVYDSVYMLLILSDTYYTAILPATYNTAAPTHDLRCVSLCRQHYAIFAFGPDNNKSRSIFEDEPLRDRDYFF